MGLLPYAASVALVQPAHSHGFTSSHEGRIWKLPRPTLLIKHVPSSLARTSSPADCSVEDGRGRDTGHDFKVMAYEDNGNRSGVWVDSLWRLEAIHAAQRSRSGKKIFLNFQHSICRVALSFKGQPDMICR
ncbi:hypothetical protein DPMN_036546 [Dreissena polymorpha]|uniref:Uncharacterized protein n=1 Tax=Dreissena polymorpha TaxID=45954 RepID=A0A9D4RM03_DREPO|nr:hypothetical protein DPMN_036546 [Dreissena polymorpha]